MIVFADARSLSLGRETINPGPCAGAWDDVTVDKLFSGPFSGAWERECLDFRADLAWAALCKHLSNFLQRSSDRFVHTSHGELREQA